MLRSRFILSIRQCSIKHHAKSVHLIILLVLFCPLLLFGDPKRQLCQLSDVSRHLDVLMSFLELVVVIFQLSRVPVVLQLGPDLGQVTGRPLHDFRLLDVLQSQVLILCFQFHVPLELCLELFLGCSESLADFFDLLEA